MAVEPRQSGLFFTQLDLQQTTVDQAGKRPKKTARLSAGDKDFERRAERQAWVRTPATDVEITFRHSGWQIERLRVQHAMIASNLPADRRERFNECGGDCVVEYSPSLKRHRMRANYCGDRFCVPCARARAKRLERAIRHRLKNTDPLFMTFTVRASKRSLTDCLNHLQKSFRRLRQQKFWVEAVSGGVAVTEIKKGTGSGQWHVHLHVLADGDYIPHAILSEGWRQASGGSFVVDIARVTRDGKGIGYVAKYAGKGWATEVVRDHDALVECMCSLRGRRLLITFGGWSKLESDPDGEQATDWVRIGRLTNVIDAHDRGEHWARGVIRSLGCGVMERQNAPPTDGPV